MDLLFWKRFDVVAVFILVFFFLNAFSRGAELENWIKLQSVREWKGRMYEYVHMCVRGREQLIWKANEYSDPISFISMHSLCSWC